MNCRDENEWEWWVPCLKPSCPPIFSYNKTAFKTPCWPWLNHGGLWIYILYATKLWNDATIMKWSIFEGKTVPWIKWPTKKSNVQQQLYRKPPSKEFPRYNYMEERISINHAKLFGTLKMISCFDHNIECINIWILTPLLGGTLKIPLQTLWASLLKIPLCGMIGHILITYLMWVCTTKESHTPTL